MPNPFIMKHLTSLLGLMLMLHGLTGQIHFSDLAKESGTWETEENYGVAFVDYDKDGWDDLYITRRLGPNRLYHNLGNGTFEDLAPEVGLAHEGDTHTAIWADIDNDGWMDIFLGNNNDEKDLLFHNQRDGTFKDISTSADISRPGDITAAVWGDVDQDGFIDLYIARLSSQNTLFRNNGDLTFTDITFQSGTTDLMIAMGAIFFDYDNDRDQDLYLVHDGYGPNILYQNDGTGHFVDVAESALVNHAAFGMGVDVGDVNRDGWLDIYITNLYPNALYLNHGDGTFTNHSSSSGTTDAGMGWGTAFLDVDNDGWSDIYVANTPSYANVLYHNLQNDSFAIISEHLPLASPGNSFGVATGDYDNDGKVDFFVTNSRDKYGNHLFHNESTTLHHWIKIKLEGTVSNRAAIGARVLLHADQSLHIDEVCGGSSWAAQNSLSLHFGLGTSTVVDSLLVLWPSGKTDRFHNLPVDSTYSIKEGQTEKPELSFFPSITIKESFRCSPNPFLDQMFIDFQLTQQEDLSILLLNAVGQEAEVLFQGLLDQGPHHMTWKNSRLPKGFYFLRVRSSREDFVLKLIRK